MSTYLALIPAPEPHRAPAPHLGAELAALPRAGCEEHIILQSATLQKTHR